MNLTKHLKTFFTVFFLFVSSAFVQAQQEITSLSGLDENLVGKKVSVNTHLILVGIGNEALLWDGNNYTYAQRSKFSAFEIGDCFNGLEGTLNNYDPNIFFVSSLGDRVSSNLSLPEPNFLTGEGLATNMYYVAVKGDIDTDNGVFIFNGNKDYRLVKYEDNYEVTDDFFKIKNLKNKTVTVIGYVEPDQANYIVVLDIWEGEKPKDFEVSVSADPKEGGTVYIDSEGVTTKTISPGTEHTLIAKPNEGWSFVEWTFNDTKVSEESSFVETPTGDGTYVAKFEKNPVYTLEVIASPGDGGTVYIDTEGVTSQTISPGTEYTITAKPNEGWRFVEWTLNDTEESKEPTHKVSPVITSTYFAKFEKKPVYTLEVKASPDDGGTVYIAGIDLKEIELDENTPVTVTATAAQGYKFNYWMLNDVNISESESYSFDISQNSVLTAVFSKLEAPSRKITFSSSEPSKGTVVAEGFPGMTSIETNQTVVLKAVPANSFNTFDYWTKNGQRIEGGSTYNYTDPEDAEFIAYFSTAYPVTFDAPVNGNLTVSVKDGKDIESGENIAENTIIEIKASPEEGYRLSSLLINESEEQTDKTSWTVPVNSPINIKAVFEKIYQGRNIKYKANNPDKGSVVAVEFPNNPAQVFTDATVTLRAVPKTEYDRFDYWTLNNEKIDGAEEIVYSEQEDADFVAYFSSSFPVTFDTPVNGNLTVSVKNGATIKSGDVVPENEDIIITVTPAEGYRLSLLLINESDEQTDKTSCTVPVNSPINIKAVFEKIYQGRNIKYKANNPDKGSVVAVEFPNNPAQVFTDATVTLRAIPKTEYDSFDYWTLNDKKIDAAEEIVYSEQEDADFVAHFSSAYPVTFDTPANGNLTVSIKNGATINSGNVISENEDIIITVTPADGYRLSSLLINESEEQTDKTSCTVPVNSPINIIAVFEKILKERTIKYKANNPAKGSVIAVEFPNNPAQVFTEATVTLRAVSKTEYDSFDYWTLNNEKIDATEEIIYSEPEDADFVAHFSSACPVIFDTPANGNLTVSVKDGATIKSGDVVPENEDIIITVTPAEGYRLSSLLINESEEEIDKTSWTVPVNSPINIIAVFEKILKERTIKYKANNPAKGSVIAVEFPNNPAQVFTDATVTLRAVPKTEYDSFDYWTLNNEKIDADEEIVYSEPEDADFVAHFSSAYPITFTSPANGTFIIKDASGNELKSGDIINEGDNIYIQLVPDAGYRVTVVKVNDVDLTFSSVSLEYEVSGPLNIVGSVEAAPIGTCFVSAISSDVKLGSVYIDTPGTTSKTVDKRTEVILHAEPAFGCKFEGWRYQDQTVFLTKDPVITREITTETHYVGVFNYIIQTPRLVTVLSSNDSKGSVRIKGENSNSVTTQKYLTLIATPASENDLFVDWTDQNGRVLSTKAEFVYDKESEATITANFTSIYRLTYSISGEEVNNVDVNLINLEDQSIITSGTVPEFSTALNEGTRLSLSIEAPEHFEVSELIIDGINVTADFYDNECNYTFAIGRNTAISVVIAPMRHSISINNHAYGSVKVYKELDSTGKGLGSPLLHGDRTYYGTRLFIFPEAVESSYALTSLSINGVEITAKGGKDYFEHLVDGDVEISPVFASVTAIDSIETDGQSDEIERVFDLSGKYFGNKLPTVPGIYIVKTKSSTRKVKVQ